MKTFICRCSEHIGIYPLSKVIRKLIICWQRTVDKVNRCLQGLTCQCSSFSSQRKGKTVQRYTTTSWLTPSSWRGKKAFSPLLLFHYAVIQCKYSLQSDILILLKQYSGIQNQLLYHSDLKQIFNTVLVSDYDFIKVPKQGNTWSVVQINTPCGSISLLLGQKSEE